MSTEPRPSRLTSPTQEAPPGVINEALDRISRPRPPPYLFATRPPAQADEAVQLDEPSNKVSVSELFAKPQLQELDQCQDELQEQLGIEKLRLECQPRVRILFLQPAEGHPLRVSDAEEFLAPAMTDDSHPLAARVLGAQHSRAQVSCACKYQSLRLNLVFIPWDENVLLSNTGTGKISVEDRPNAIHILEVQPQEVIEIFPGCWKVSDNTTSMEFRLRPRRYRVLVKEYSAKRRAGQSSSNSKRMIVPSAQLLALAGEDRNAQEPMPVEPCLHVALRANPLRQKQTLHMVDEVTGKLEYSVEYLDHYSSSSKSYDVIKAIYSEQSSKPMVVAVKMCKVDYSRGSLVIPQAIFQWQREFKAQRKLEHPCIASLVGFDARLLLLMVEHKESRNLEDHRWQYREGKNRYFFKGDIADACTIVADMASALAYLAEMGIVHNDIAPMNILYSRMEIPGKGPQGRTKSGAILIDFGTGRVLAEEKGGISAGRPWYVAPEWMGAVRDLPADVWSLGVVMLYLLRRMKLPHKWFSSWSIHDISRQGSEARRMMQRWLDEIDKLREGLRDSGRQDAGDKGKLERLVAQMLSAVAERISANELARETSKWASVQAK